MEWELGRPGTSSRCSALARCRTRVVSAVWRLECLASLILFCSRPCLAYHSTRQDLMNGADFLWRSLIDGAGAISRAIEGTTVLSSLCWSTFKGIPKQLGVLARFVLRALIVLLTF
ncbi:hypothetical protein EDB19DRAFT_1692062 [Suillus lakei]|nr:hypothetical protein EDB19DRAFT_1692062 [Suillus lakei]